MPFSAKNGDYRGRDVVANLCTEPTGSYATLAVSKIFSITPSFLVTLFVTIRSR